MHSTDYLDMTFHHNGDYSGEVLVQVPAGNVRGGFGDAHVVVEVPFAALVSLVADAVRGQRIARLENMPDAEILGIQ